jgi:hypothetical protein
VTNKASNSFLPRLELEAGIGIPLPQTNVLFSEMLKRWLSGIESTA